MTNEDFEFGEPITISNKLHRSVSYSGNGYPFKYWQAKRLAESQGNKAIFLGFRTLSNGNREYDSEYGYGYYAKQHFRAALVVTGANENPFYTILDDLEFEEFPYGVIFDTRKLARKTD